MFTKEEIKTYQENIRKEQIQVTCKSCGFKVWMFPEHENNSKCHCGGNI